MSKRNFTVAAGAAAAALTMILPMGFVTAASAAPGAGLGVQSRTAQPVEKVGYWARHRYYGDNHHVRAPFTDVHSGRRGTRVHAPFASVDTRGDHVRVRAPFVHLFTRKNYD